MAGNGNAPACAYTDATSRHQGGLAASLLTFPNAYGEAAMIRDNGRDAPDSHPDNLIPFPLSGYRHPVPSRIGPVGETDRNSPQPL